MEICSSRLIASSTSIFLLSCLISCTSSPQIGTAASSVLLEEQTITPIYMPGIPYVEAEDLTPTQLNLAEDRGNVQIHQEYEFSDGTTYDYLSVGDYVVESGDILVSTVTALEEELEEQDQMIEAGDYTLTAQGGLFYNTRGWPRGIIYIDERSYSAFTSTQVTSIRNAMQHITDKTNVGFLPRTTGNRIYFRDYGGCASELGMVGNDLQNIFLQNDCFSSVNPADNFGTIVHELSHAAAFIHEHQRGDRNDYVDIVETNLTEKGRKNILNLARTSYRTGYDFPSVMHYARRVTGDFVINPNINTINTPGYTGAVAQQRLTPRDIQTYNYLYP